MILLLSQNKTCLKWMYYVMIVFGDISVINKNKMDKIIKTLLKTHSFDVCQIFVLNCEISIRFKFYEINKSLKVSKNNKKIYKYWADIILNHEMQLNILKKIYYAEYPKSAEFKQMSFNFYIGLKYSTRPFFNISFHQVDIWLIFKKVETTWTWNTFFIKIQ